MKKIYFTAVMVASLFLGACTSDDKVELFTEARLNTTPIWQIDWNNNQARPNWTEPDGSLYENWTILKVQIEDELIPYASEGDLMALFVNGELRGLAGPAVNASDGKTADGKFLMKAYGNESGNETVHMALRYYCQTLNHIFTLEDDISLDSDVTTGIDEDYIPLFTLGAEKYPVMKVVDVDSIITKVGLTPALDGEVGAFVGDECRGAAPISPFGGTMLLIYGCRAGESIALQYYDANLKILFTIPNAVVM